MVKDKQGNLYTDKEFCNKSINEARVDIKDTEAVMKRLDELILEFEKTTECKHAYSKLERQYKLVRERLQQEDLKLVTEINNCFTRILILYEEYFYAQGYRDGVRTKGILKRITLWLINGLKL